MKRALNRGLFEDMEQQLYARYLQRDFNFGIYLVAQFACPVWNQGSDWRRNAPGVQTSILELQRRLDEQTALLSSQEKKLSAIVIDAGMKQKGERFLVRLSHFQI